MGTSGIMDYQRGIANGQNDLKFAHFDWASAACETQPEIAIVACVRTL
jgi:hypothetical protein